MQICSLAAAGMGIGQPRRGNKVRRRIKKPTRCPCHLPPLQQRPDNSRLGNNGHPGGNVGGGKRKSGGPVWECVNITRFTC